MRSRSHARTRTHGRTRAHRHRASSRDLTVLENPVTPVFPCCTGIISIRRSFVDVFSLSKLAFQLRAAERLKKMPGQHNCRPPVVTLIDRLATETSGPERISLLDCSRGLPVNPWIRGSRLFPTLRCGSPKNEIDAQRNFRVDTVGKYSSATETFRCPPVDTDGSRQTLLSDRILNIRTIR